MKKLPIVILIMLLLLSIQVYGETSDAENLLDNYAASYGNALTDGIDNADNNMFRDIVGDYTLSDVIKQINNGEIPLSPWELVKIIFKLLLGEVLTGAKLMALIVLVAILGSYLGEMEGAFASDAISKCALYACFTVIAGVAASAFSQAATVGMEAIKNIAFFMRCLVPAMITALATSGSLISAAALQPVLLVIIEISVWITEKLCYPTVMIATALNIVNGMSRKFKTDKLVKFLNGAVKWGLSVILTVFVSIVAIKGLASSGADGLSVKLTKFATTNLVPVVGGILSESVETVMGCSILIKNSIGILGIIALLAIVLTPIIKLGALTLLFKLTAAITQPVSHEKISECIEKLSESLGVLFSIVVAVTLMSVIVITILISSGGRSAMVGG